MIIKRPLSRQPLPDNAECVFRGEIFEVYQWEQKLFDGSVARFEKIKRPDTADVLAVVDGKILLSKQEQPGIKPFINILGGRIDPGEDPLTAAKRELLEESGYEADEWILWDASQPLEKVDYATYIFIAKKCRKVRGQHIDAGEKIELMPVTFEELFEISSQENFRDILLATKLLRVQRDPARLAEFKRILA